MPSPALVQCLVSGFRACVAYNYHLPALVLTREGTYGCTEVPNLGA